MNQTVDDKKLGNTKILQDCCSVLDNQVTLWYKNWENTKRVQCKVCKATWNKDVVVIRVELSLGLFRYGWIGVSQSRLS